MDLAARAESRHVRRAESSSSFLHPQDAFYYNSPPRHPAARSDSPGKHAGSSAAEAPSAAMRSRSLRPGSRSRSRRRSANGGGMARGPWKKLLWVKQNYPDNYTDAETFLDHLEWNPRIRPYEFWSLVADSTIIVQHVCSVVIFICSFIAIFRDRVSPQTVVGWATFCAVAGWVFRDYWQSRDEAEHRRDAPAHAHAHPHPPPDSPHASTPSSSPGADAPSPSHSRNPSSTPSVPAPEVTVPTTPPFLPPYGRQPSLFSPKMQDRLTTVKSAILIYCSLLGLSPILKSLTMSTSSDSIWALASWLMGINVCTFDYGAGPEAKFPASLSTNAALMASTVLASRLPDTAHVFSLTLFSIEVFGLFPVFRRHLRHHSWDGHLCLTAALVVLAGAGLGVTVPGGGWGMALLGVLLSAFTTCLGMGGTSWYLITLQQFKNEIRGPWDPARPVIRRHWE